MICFPTSIGAAGEEVMLLYTMCAGDMIIPCGGMDAAQKMLDDVQATFAFAGLRVNPERCKYIFQGGRTEVHRLSHMGADITLEGFTAQMSEDVRLSWAVVLE